MHRALLIADGDIELCNLLEMYLGENGYQVETASDATDCMTKLRHFMPTVLVLDLELRWGMGNDVLSWLRKECSNRCSNVILTGPNGYQLDTRTIFEPPVVDYLSKPFTADALLESIHSAIATAQFK